MDRIIQLGLTGYDSSDPEIKIVWLIDQLLDVLTENLANDDRSGAQFRSHLEQLRHEIIQSGGKSAPRPVAMNALELCRQQFRESQARNTRRDEQFAEIILFLRTALANLAGDSNVFNSSILETSGRFKMLVQINDIDEIKSKLAVEVSQLNKAIQEKQKRDQIQYEELSRQVALLQSKLKEAKAEASKDGLTGIANRRDFEIAIKKWINEKSAAEEPFTIAVFDLDNFKSVNDNHGHLVGDQVLIAAANILNQNIRDADYLARYGGEEFVVLSSAMKLAESENRFSNILKIIENTPLQCKKDNAPLTVSITVSCGVAEYALGENAKDLIARADEALYEAKKKGKNRAVSKRRPLLSAFYEGRRRMRTPRLESD
jgi:diguanylate cyclase